MRPFWYPLLTLYPSGVKHEIDRLQNDLALGSVDSL